MTATRIAVLIDADNTSPKHASALLEELAKYGVSTVKRAYGDWTTPQLGGWKTELNQHAIVPVQQFAYTTGKNSTDSALIIDAMDLLYSGNLDAFALVSSDSDFTRLATRIRESGMTVYGLGLRKTPQSLVAACDTFIYLEVLGKETTSGQPAEPVNAGGDAPDDPPLPNLQSLLVRGINNSSDEDGWVNLGGLGNYLRTASPSFDPRLYGFPKLLSLVEAQPFLTVTGSGSGVKVSQKGKAPAKAVAKKVPARKTPSKKEPTQEASPPEATAATPAAEVKSTKPVVTTTTRNRAAKKTAQPKG